MQAQRSRRKHIFLVTNLIVSGVLILPTPEISAPYQSHQVCQLLHYNEVFLMLIFLSSVNSL